MQLSKYSNSRPTADGFELSSIVNRKNAVTESSLLNLRKGLSIIPQEPFIFADTIRKNIDPLEESEDNDIWEVVENCGLDEKIRNLSEGLSYELAEKGANLSVGEKQLIWYISVQRDKKLSHFADVINM